MNFSTFLYGLVLFLQIISGEDGMVDDRQVFSPSEAVASMLEEFVELYRHNCAATFLISFLEDRLGSILSKSNVLTRLVTTSGTLRNSFLFFKLYSYVFNSSFRRRQIWFCHSRI